MAFQTLEERFNSVSKDIYGRFSNSDQIVEPIRPDSPTNGLSIRDDNRGLPVISTTRDVKLIGKFMLTSKGLLSLGKQGLLQTGNTFAETRLYNPASPLANTVPFLHINRMVSGNISQHRGALQSETIANLKTSSNLLTRIRSGVVNALHSPFGSLNSKPKKVNGFYERPEDVAFIKTQIIYAGQALENRGEKKGPATTIEKATFNEEYNRYKKNTFADFTYPNGLLANGYFTTNRLLNVNNNEYPSNTTVPRSSAEVASAAASAQKSEERNLGSIGDAYNSRLINPETFEAGHVSYGSIEVPTKDTKKTDIIKFVFESMGSEPVYFRAFISAIKQNVKPEFNSQRYVGRNERFVTYAGATRTLALSFNIVAFSQKELDNMWLRINYLTGLAFPKSISDSGFMTPPLFKLTVGGLYDRHPCYIESLDFDFLDDSITFDIDSEVSQVINVTMNVSLFEKRSRFHDSPFYAITEKVANTGTKVSAPKSTPTISSTPIESPPTPPTPTPRAELAVTAAPTPSNASTVTTQRTVVPRNVPRVPRPVAESTRVDTAAPAVPRTYPLVPDVFRRPFVFRPTGPTIGPRR